MNIAKKDIETLEKYILNIHEMLSVKSVTDILEMIDDLIIDDILEHEDEPSNTGRELQLIYDRIQRDK